MHCPYCDHESESMEDHTDHVSDEHQELVRALFEGEPATIVEAVQERVTA